jgi:hypothetical protein
MVCHWGNVMKKILHLTIICALITVIGLVETVGAAPDGSQRLRGLGGRVFLVEVEVAFAEDCCGLPPVGFVFANCYFFEPDGTWIDPAFPRPGAHVSGNWMQHSTGAKTSYTASVDAGVVLIQEGTVTPANGGGVLQLEAFTTVWFGDFALAGFVSVGSEVDECPL